MRRIEGLLSRISSAVRRCAAGHLSGYLAPVLLAALAATPPSSAQPALAPVYAATSGVQPVRGYYDPASSVVRLSNSQIRVVLTYSDGDVARLTLLPPSSDSPLVLDASTTFSLPDGSSINLASDARPTGRVSLEPVEEPGLGTGLQLRAEANVARLGTGACLELTLFEDRPYLTYRWVLPQGLDTTGEFSYLDGVLLPDAPSGSITYVADNDVLREGTLPSSAANIPIGQGKPILLRDGRESLLMAILDPSDAPSTISSSPVAGGTGFQWRQRFPASTESMALPRLFVARVNDTDMATAFEPYRAVMSSLYPPAPLPSWFRHQWMSWYLYGTSVDEEKLKSQIDYLAGNLADVGPWSILIDAGWYVAGGEDAGDWREVDGGKFPSGLRALVDYAHERDIKVVLYFSGSYLDDRQDDGNWLGLKGIIDQHPEWLVPINSGDPWNAFYYDYSNPGFQQYLKGIINDFFVTYGVDGIKVDGMEDSRLAVQRGMRSGLYTPSERPILPTTSAYAFIYREASALRPDVYVEAGWRLPTCAAPYYTVARQSDDYPDFASTYPTTGLLGHVDYAIAQLLLMGQRPHLGNFWGDPNDNAIGLRWLEAGIALSAPVALGFDLNDMSEQTLREYRARLAHLSPFSGEVRIPGGLHSESFSSAVDGTTYLALFNRGDQPKEIRANVAAHGLAGDVRLSAYDVSWGHSLPVNGAVVARLDPQELRLFAIRSEPGVLWTDSSSQSTQSDRSISLELGGPSSAGGHAYLAVPNPGAVLLNGAPLAADLWSYDAQAGVLQAEFLYDSSGKASLEVSY